MLGSEIVLLQHFEYWILLGGGICWGLNRLACQNKAEFFAVLLIINDSEGKCVKPQVFDSHPNQSTAYENVN